MKENTDQQSPIRPLKPFKMCEQNIYSLYHILGQLYYIVPSLLNSWEIMWLLSFFNSNFHQKELYYIYKESRWISLNVYYQDTYYILPVFFNDCKMAHVRKLCITCNIDIFDNIFFFSLSTPRGSFYLYLSPLLGLSEHFNIVSTKI